MVAARIISSDGAGSVDPNRFPKKFGSVALVPGFVCTRFQYHQPVNDANAACYKHCGRKSRVEHALHPSNHIIDGSFSLLIVVHGVARSAFGSDPRVINYLILFVLKAIPHGFLDLYCEF